MTLLDKEPIIKDGKYDKQYLVMDIETFPSRGLYYNQWQVGNIIKRERPWFIMSWSYNYLEDNKIHHKSVRDYKEWKKAYCKGCNDLHNPFLAEEKLVQDIYKIMREISVVIGHNSNSFDNKKLTSKFIKYGLPPLPNYIASFDTKSEYKKVANTDSHKLDDLGDELHIGRKEETRKNIQLACIDNKPGAWEELRKYNNQDVKLDKELFLRIRGYKKTGGLNYNVIKGTAFNCTMCGSMYTLKEGVRSGYQRYSCQNCGKWMRGEKVKMDKPLS